MKVPPEFFQQLLSRIVEDSISTKRELHNVKLDLCGKYNLGRVPSDSEILSHASPEIYEKIKSLLKVKPTRSASGVAVVSVMTAPHPCPHGKCIYCPGGPEIGTPQSYTGHEPAAMRALQNDYDPYRQTVARLGQLKVIGHPTDKIELIIIGGTFTNLDGGYRTEFVKRCFDALNGRDARSLMDAQAINELAGSRCVGLTIETRPDCFDGDVVRSSLGLGVTRVEFGVQSIADDVLLKVNRGHTNRETIQATAVAKDAGLKVCYHMMPGLPGSDEECDIASFKTVFEDERYMPDMLKIYPTVVLNGTGLYDMWRRGEYEPFTTEKALRLLVEIKRIVPPWIRIQRIQREIDLGLIEAGLDKGHLRDLARGMLAASGERCGCIRCREVGLHNHTIKSSDVMLKRLEYDASGGHETFLSLENADSSTLVGYLRLRSCDTGTYLRELKVFGDVVPFGEPPEDRWQHQGYGRQLVAECEKIAEDEFDASELKVTSGIGVRDYYRRFGYKLQGPYMVKTF